MARAAPLFLLAALVAVAFPAQGQQRRTDLSLTVSEGLREVRGTVRVELRSNATEPVDELWLWLPANRLAEPPEGLDQRNAHWIYPRAFGPGRIDLETLAVGETDVDLDVLEFPDLRRHGLGQGQRILARVPLAPPLEPGAVAVVRARFRTVVPARFGRFGRARGVLTLAGGFYPQVAALGPGGWELSGPMAESTYEVEVRVTPGSHVVLNGTHARAPGDDGRVRAELAAAPYLSLVVAPRLFTSTVRVGGVEVEYLSRRRRFHPPRPTTGPRRRPLGPDGVPDAMEWDYEGRVLRAATGAVEVLDELGLGPPDGTVIRLVEVPLRLEMVAAVPGGALVSDRVYRVTPLEPFHRFHDLQVVRAVAWSVLGDAVRREPPSDRGWALDLLAAAAADGYAEARHGGRGDGLRGLLRWGSFIPEVDQLMYSPLIEFRHLFLRPFRDEDPVRDEPWRLASSWPRGAVLHDRLADLLGSEATRRLLVTYPSQQGTIREAVADVAGEEMGWFFDQWLGPYPSVNYRIVDVSTERRGEGGYLHRVELERQGDDIREPVTVRLVERGGERHEVVWDGRGPRGVVEVACDGPLSRVVVDPRHRLVEDPSLAGNNARLDNVRPSRWRPPVFNGLMFYVSAAEGALYALVDFALRRQYDARHGLRLRLEYEPRGLRGDVFYQAGLGPLLDLNRASWVLTAGLSARRTVGSFGRDDVGASAFGAGLTLRHDTRWFPYDPMEGWGMSVGVAGSGNVTDEGQWGWALAASTRVAGHWTPRTGHSFTGFAGGGIVFGLPLDEQLQSISDRFMLRAFEADETLGRARLYAGVEYRLTVVHDLDVNLFHLARLRAIFLVAFLAGGTVSHEDDLGGLFTPSRLYSEVGGGGRVLLEIAGVVPYIVAVDVAYPITPGDRQACNGEGLCRDRAPVGVYVSIQHTM